MASRWKVKSAIPGDSVFLDDAVEHALNYPTESDVKSGVSFGYSLEFTGTYGAWPSPPEDPGTLGIWFVDTAAGDDGNDGKQGEQDALSVPGEITDADATTIFISNADAAELTAGDIRFFSSNTLAKAGWYEFVEVVSSNGESRCTFTYLRGDKLTMCDDLAAVSTGPFKTIAQAVSVAQPGDWIYVKIGGVYVLQSRGPLIVNAAMVYAPGLTAFRVYSPGMMAVQVSSAGVQACQVR